MTIEEDYKDLLKYLSKECKQEILIDSLITKSQNIPNINKEQIVTPQTQILVRENETQSENNTIVRQPDIVNNVIDVSQNINQPQNNTNNMKTVNDKNYKALNEKDSLKISKTNEKPVKRRCLKSPQNMKSSNNSIVIKRRKSKSVNKKSTCVQDSLIAQLHAQHSPIKRLKRIGANVQPSQPEKVSDEYVESEEESSEKEDENLEEDDSEEEYIEKEEGTQEIGNDRIDLHIRENDLEEDLGFCFKTRKKKVWWTPEETEALIDGVKTYGRGRWKEIYDDNIVIFGGRRKVKDLSDRMRIIDKKASLYTYPDTIYTEIDENNKPYLRSDGTPKTFICKFPHEAALLAASERGLIGTDDIIKMSCDDESGKAIHIYRMVKGFNGRKRVRKISGRSNKRIDGW